MNVVLKMAVGQLDEVIVSTGYTQTTQKRTTGSVAVVGREVFENKVPTSIDQLLPVSYTHLTLPTTMRV